MKNARQVARLPHFVAGVILLHVVNGLCALAESEEPFRTWTSGRHEVVARAKWVSDADGRQMVGLERKDNGRTVEVRVRQLSASDRAYLARYVARLRREARENAASTTPSKPKVISRTQAIANISAAIEKAADRDERRQLERIRSNLEGGYTKLSIFRLTKIPPEVWSMTYLTELLIIECRLTELSPGIGNLTNLNKLILQNNQLATLPPEIGNLKKLELLNLDANQLAKLPPEIGELSNLKYLDIGYFELKTEAAINQLTELPPEIGDLKNLTRLELKGNRLTSLPPEIGKLQNLTHLLLRKNQVTSLPAEIAGMPKLQFLILEDNPITDEGAKSLKSLNKVYIELGGTNVTKAGAAEIRAAGNSVSLQKIE
jgi:Leucine-rich repeat (LRR) protein